MPEQKLPPSVVAEQVPDWLSAVKPILLLAAKQALGPERALLWAAVPVQERVLPSRELVCGNEACYPGRY